MSYYGLSWTEATSLRLWEIAVMEDEARDRQRMEENRKRLT